MSEHKIRDSLTRLEQLERRQKLRKQQEECDNEKLKERRTFIVGRLFLEAFPEFMAFKPQSSTERDEQEFSPLRNFLTKLSGREDVRAAVKRAVESHR